MTSIQERYIRQQVLRGFGEQGQARLEAACVLIVGIGGLGSPAAAYLAAAGVGHLVINDFDKVHSSNLHRQILYTDSDMDSRKAESAADRLREINPGTRLTVLDYRLAADDLDECVARADVVLDGTDNFASRVNINAACVKHARPLVSGAAAGMDGQVSVFACDRDGPCYQCFLDDIGDNMADCEGVGILGPVTGVIGSMMALETIKVLTGMGEPLSGCVMVFDGSCGEFRKIRLSRSASCVACAAG